MSKKPEDLNDEIVHGLAAQVLMFDSWSMDTGLGGLDLDKRLLLTERLLQFAGFSGAQSEIDVITLGMIALNPEYDLDRNRQLRKATNFDGTVPQLGELLDLPESFYRRL